MKKKECVIGFVRQIVLTDPAYESHLWRSATSSDEFKFTIAPAPPFATVSWARSKVATDFLNHTPGDVMIMMDSDMSAEPWEFEKLAKEALERDAIVGSLLCKRAAGRGFCNLFKDPVLAGSDEVREVGDGEFIGAAFTAYPRTVLERLAKHLPYLPKKKMYPFFIDKIAKVQEGEEEYYDLLTEDRVFCMLARGHGEKIFCDMSLSVQHWGFFGFRPHHAKQGMFLPKAEESRDEHA